MTSRFSVNFSTEDRERLDKLAAKRQRSKNDIIREALTLYAFVANSDDNDQLLVRSADGDETRLFVL